MKISRRHFVYGTALALAGGGAYLLGRGPAADPVDPDVLASHLGAQQGVVVRFGDPSTFYVPPYLPADAAIPYVTLRAVDRSVVGDALHGIEQAFKAYPDQFLARVIKAVFIAGQIILDGAEAGGTYGMDWIVLAAPLTVSRKSRHLTAELGVHHETSSFLWSRNAALRHAFTALAPMGWKFQDNATDEIARAGQTAPPLETGFLSAYGATTPENDFNTYAETIFSDPAKLKQAAQRVPLIAHKLALVLPAYVHVDQRLEQIFARSGLAAVAEGLR